MAIAPSGQEAKYGRLILNGKVLLSVRNDCFQCDFIHPGSGGAEFIDELPSSYDTSYAVVLDC